MIIELLLSMAVVAIIGIIVGVATMERKGKKANDTND